MEMCVVTIVNSGDAVGGNVQRLADALALKVRDGDYLPAFLQYARYYQTAVVPSHFLVERGTAMLARLQIDNVMECQYQRNGTP